MPGSLSTDRIIAALESVAREVHGARLEHSPDAFSHIGATSSAPEVGVRDASIQHATHPGTVIAALDQLTATVREYGETEARRHQYELQRALLPCLEPLRQGWSPLEFMGRQHDERSWTQWLAHLLKHKNTSGNMTWRALCTTVEEAARRTPPERRMFSRLANARRWEVIKDEEPVKITPEEPTINGYAFTRLAC